MSVATGSAGNALDPDDFPSNPSTARHFNELVEARLSRRSVLTGGMLAAAGFLTTSVVGTRTAAARTPHGGGHGGGHGGPGGALLGFQPIGPGTGDDVVVPPGYTARPFIPWGTPLLGSLPAFVPGSRDAGVAGGNTAEEQGQQVGMHHDGMTYFPIDHEHGDEHGLLVVNHEYTDEYYLHTGAYVEEYTEVARDSYTQEMVRKSQNAHGVSVAEIRKGHHGEWELVNSPLNRRITANTPIQLAGPVAGDRLVTTDRDPSGTTALGTMNNCANGETPWGTYLTCEENFNGYFALEGEDAPGFDPAQVFGPEDAQLLDRYGVGGDRFNWATNDRRFVVSPREPHEPNRFGWVVEIDPFDPRSRPVKRTALGRLKHEDATVHVTKGGRVVVYMGDDEVNEYVYKFVSARNWQSMRAQGKSPLDEGTLYVARFDENGTGVWLPLVHGQGPLTAANGFASQADVLVKTRLAADALGATPMDRPEWTAVDPRTGTVYVTLTNNTRRTAANAANPRVANKWGHIVRWDEQGGDHRATSFVWDIFLLAGPGRDSATPEGSTILAEDAFGSPDGLWLDPDSRVWIQTDGSQPGAANNQMLAADPYLVDDAGQPEVRRFLTGVIGCEVTGIAMTPDQRTLFINLQHPGEDGGSSWPHDDEFTTPRSATVVVTKDDGGVIGT